MLEFIRGLQVVNPILMEYPSIAATAEVNHATFYTQFSGQRNGKEIDFA
jgi:hypothetical protein